MDMDPANDGARRERRQPSHRDRSWTSPARGAHPSGPRRSSRSRDRRGRHEGQSSWSISSSLITQQPWRRGTNSTSTTPSTVPRPVVLPSMRSEGHPSPASLSDGGGEREVEAGEEGRTRKEEGGGRGTSNESLETPNNCNNAASVPSAPQTLVLDAAARRELERRIEEQLKASDIGVAWADIDEDDFDPNVDPFAEKGQSLTTPQQLGNDGAGMRESAKVDALSESPNKMEGEISLEKGALNEDGNSPSEKVNRSDMNKESPSHARCPPPLPLSSSPPLEALEALTLAAVPVREKERDEPRHRHEQARISNSHPHSHPQAHTHVPPSPVKPPRTSQQLPPAPEMITRYIPVRLNADVTEEVIPVKLPLRNC